MYSDEVYKRIVQTEGCTKETKAEAVHNQKHCMGKGVHGRKQKDTTTVEIPLFSTALLSEASR